MNPEQPPQYSIDYLNQIAPPPPKTGPSRAVAMILLGLGVAALIVICMVVFSSLKAGPTNDLQHLAAHLASLKTVTTTAQQTIQSSQLRSDNSNLAIVLSNASRDIEKPLTSEGLDAKNLDKSIVASESSDKLTATLENARLNAVYDETYAREITYELATINILMAKIYNETSNSVLKSYLSTTDKNLRLVQQQFTAFSAPSNDPTGQGTDYSSNE